MEEFLEELSLNAWPAIRQVHYDNWVLRFAGGHTRRSNSVNVLGASAISLDEKIAYCESAYQRAGLPAIFKFAGIPGTEELEEELKKRGYEFEAPTLVMTCDHLSASQVANPEFRYEPELTREWFEMVTRFTCIDESRKGDLDQILQNIVPNRCFGCMYLSNQPASIGIAVAERNWLGLFDIVTAPEFRRRGLGTNLIRSLMGWGQTHGAYSAYLQVVEENQTAISLYESLGFEPRYHYWYRTKRWN